MEDRDKENLYIWYCYCLFVIIRKCGYFASYLEVKVKCQTTLQFLPQLLQLVKTVNLIQSTQGFNASYYGFEIYSTGTDGGPRSRACAH